MEAGIINKSAPPRARIKVAQIIETMGMGGAENLAVQISGALAQRGFDSHLVVMTGPGPLSERIHPDVKVHYLGYWRGSIRNPASFLLSLRRGKALLTGVLRQQGIELAQTHLPGANFWGLSLALSRICRVVATVHNNQEFRYGDTDNRVLLFLRKQAYRQIVTRCDGTIAVSEKVKESLAADLGLGVPAADKITVVTNGVSLPAPLSAPEKEALRNSLGLEPGQALILAAGRLGRQKNFGDLIDAASRLATLGHNFKVVIGGEGEDAAVLREKVVAAKLEDWVYLPGNLPNLRQIMQAADIYAMSSLWEGLPLVLLEAMAARLPVVAYGIPGVLELVKDQESGLLAVTGDSEDLARKLAALLSDPEVRNGMGEAGYKLVREQFNFDDLMGQICTLYSLLVPDP